MAAKAVLTEAQRSDLLELLGSFSKFFWGPDHQQCRRLSSKEYFRPFDRLAPVLGDSARDAIDKLKDLIQNCRDAAALFDSLEEAYIPLFVNARGGIAAPLYQSCYPVSGAPQVTAALMGAPAERMQQRFSSRELGLDPSLKEPPDHLAVELEYLYYLLEKGWAEDDGVLLGEAADFTNRELLAWIPEFERRLRAALPGTFFPLVTVILLAVLRLITEI